MMTKDMMERLAIPFERAQISLRVGSVTKDKAKAIPLCYVDARDVMARLDEAVGCENWKDEYIFVGNRNMCKLSVRIGDEWVYKTDGAGDTNIEGEKGGISDAFKRAAVKWGVGRELYKYRFMYAPIDAYGKFVDSDAVLWDKYLLNNKQNHPKVTKVIKAPKENRAEKLKANILKSLATVSDLSRFKAMLANETIKAWQKELSSLDAVLFDDCHKAINARGDELGYSDD